MRRAGRTVVFLVFLVAAATWSASSMFALGNIVHPDRPATALIVPSALVRPLNTLTRNSKLPRSISVALLGDSTAIAYPEGKRIHDRLSQDLASRWTGRASVYVASLSSLGMTPAGFYLLADPITAAHADVAIVTFNLGLATSRLPASLQRPELAGWVFARRWWQTLVELDLHKYGVTADRLLLYRLFVLSGQTSLWLEQTSQQARLGALRPAVEQLFADRFDFRGELATRQARTTLTYMEEMAPGSPPRRSARSAQRYYRGVMDGLGEDHWVAAVTRALLQEFARAGTRTILYVPPINVEYTRSVGAYDEAGIGRTLAMLERLALDTGAEFADLHDLLPDAAFRDNGGHFTHEPPYDGPQLVAEALTPYVELLVRDVSTTR